MLAIAAALALGINGYAFAQAFPASMNLGSLNGNSVGAAGDVNGDHIDDLIVGASEHSYVVFGRGTTLDFAIPRWGGGGHPAGAERKICRRLAKSCTSHRVFLPLPGAERCGHRLGWLEQPVYHAATGSPAPHHQRNSLPPGGVGGLQCQRHSSSRSHG